MAARAGRAECNHAATVAIRTEGSADALTVRSKDQGGLKSRPRQSAPNHCPQPLPPPRTTLITRVCAAPFSNTFPNA